jgi:hypothetical protein
MYKDFVGNGDNIKEEFSSSDIHSCFSKEYSLISAVKIRTQYI